MYDARPQRLEACAEVAQESGLLDDLVPVEFVPPIEHRQDGLDHEVDVALGKHAPRYGESNEFVRSRNALATRPL